MEEVGCVRSVMERGGENGKNRDDRNNSVDSREYDSGNINGVIVENVERVDRAEWSKRDKEEKGRKKRWI